jgi:hypothetical protein
MFEPSNAKYTDSFLCIPSGKNVPFRSDWVWVIGGVPVVLCRKDCFSLKPSRYRCRRNVLFHNETLALSKIPICKKRSLMPYESPATINNTAMAAAANTWLT